MQRDMKSVVTAGVRWAAGLLVFTGALITACAAELPFKILTTEEPPVNYTIGAELTGITTDIVTDLQRHMGDTTAIEVQPWSRIYQTALVRPNVLIFTLARTPDRVAQGLTFIGPVTTRRHILYKRADSNLKIDSLDDIKQQNLIVGSVRADWRTKLMQDNGIRVDETETHDMNLRLMMLGRVQLCALSDLELKINADLAGVSLSKLAPALVIKEAASYIALSKGTPEHIVTQWQNAFAEFQKSDEPEKLAKKWGDILGAPMSYTPAKGLYLTK